VTVDSVSFPTNNFANHDVTGTVTLSDEAPSGGAVVTLSGSRPGIATVPASVTVPFGESSATFSVSTQRSGLDRDVVVSAQYDGLVRTGTLHLREMAEARSPRDTATEGAPSRSPHRAGPRAVPRNTVFAPKRASIQVSAPSRLDPETQTETPERRFYFYTPELNLLAETELTADATPDIEYEYIWFGGQPVAQIATATDTISWYFNDHLGTPVLQTDASAEVVWRVEREPFGKTFEVRAGAELHQPLAFPGQEEDGGDTAYNIHRWYRAGWGRYTQGDPIGAGGLGLYYGNLLHFSQRQMADLQDNHTNLYSYAWNDPVKATDASGLVTAVVVWSKWRDAHSALHIDNAHNPLLYDPSGNYPGPGLRVRGSDDTFQGDDADLPSYLHYWHKRGHSSPEVFLFDTTPAEEAEIARNIEELGEGGSGPFDCALLVSESLRVVGMFDELGRVRWPGKLAKYLRHLMQQQVLKNGQ
jgi:RHS repeat-associated protein